MSDTKQVPTWPTDRLHVIIDALDDFEKAINADTTHPWRDYDSAFGGPLDFEDDEPAPDEVRKAAYLSELDRARMDVTRLLDLGIPLP